MTPQTLLTFILECSKRKVCDATSLMCIGIENLKPVDKPAFLRLVADNLKGASPTFIEFARSFSEFYDGVEK